MHLSGLKKRKKIYTENSVTSYRQKLKINCKNSSCKKKQKQRVQGKFYQGEVRSSLLILMKPSCTTNFGYTNILHLSMYTWCALTATSATTKIKCISEQSYHTDQTKKKKKGKEEIYNCSLSDLVGIFRWTIGYSFQTFFWSSTLGYVLCTFKVLA